MHDIKVIRNNPDIFFKKVSERNTKVNIKSLLDLDKRNRDLIQDKEKLEQEKKIISQKKDKNLFDKSKEISLKINLIIKDKYSLTLASSWMGNTPIWAEVSKERKNFIASGIIK